MRKESEHTHGVYRCIDVNVLFLHETLHGDQVKYCYITVQVSKL